MLQQGARVTQVPVLEANRGGGLVGLEHVEADNGRRPTKGPVLLIAGSSVAASIFRPVGVTDTMKCFRCHCTLTSRHGRDRLDLDELMPNVSCERCHGPGRSHIEAARRGAPAEELIMPLGPERVKFRLGTALTSVLVSVMPISLSASPLIAFTAIGTF